MTDDVSAVKAWDCWRVGACAARVSEEWMVLFLILRHWVQSSTLYLAAHDQPSVRNTAPPTMVLFIRDRLRRRMTPTLSSPPSSHSSATPHKMAPKGTRLTAAVCMALLHVAGPSEAQDWRRGRSGIGVRPISGECLRSVGLSFENGQERSH